MVLHVMHTGLPALKDP